jgi:cobalt-zinc-cadmium efflux system outer membrane protein
VVSAGLDYIDFLRAFTPSNGGGPTEWNLRTDFLLERGGKRERRIEVAQGAREVAQLQLLNTTRTLVLDVQNAFVDVQQAKDNLALAKENLQAFQSIVDVNATRVRTGDLAKVELVRTQVAAQTFQNAVRQAEAKLTIASVKLQNLIGRTTPTPDFDVVGDLRRDPEPVVLANVSSQALELRPDLQALRKDQARSQAEVRSQLAQGKVDFTVGAEYHREFHNGNANALGVFFQAPLPVWNKNQGEIERARREQDQIVAKIRAAEADVQTEVRNAWTQYSTSKSLLESIERDLLQQAQEVRDTMEYSYRRGEASLVEFLDAQRAFNDARQSANDARADFARSLYTIDAISGKAVR